LGLRPALSYLICCAERTGSTLLGDALIGTGIAGRPRSYFNRAAHFNPRMQRILGNAKDDDGYLDRVLGAATTPNAVFGAKVHWAHLLNLAAKIGRGPPVCEGAAPRSVPERLRMHFPDLRYIWLVRRNAVARAISHYRVKKSNRWQLDSRWITDDTGGDGEPGFDFDEIDAFVRIGEIEDAHWRKFFLEHDVAPLKLSYEDLVQDLETSVRDVLGFLGIPAETIKVAPPTLRKQADRRSQEWEARYRRMCTDASA
jgi:LPS sulfotransferase NodH